MTFLVAFSLIFLVSDQKKKLQKAPKRLKNNTTLLDGAQKVAQARDFEKK